MVHAEPHIVTTPGGLPLHPPVVEPGHGLHGPPLVPGEAVAGEHLARVAAEHDATELAAQVRALSDQLADTTRQLDAVRAENRRLALNPEPRRRIPGNQIAQKVLVAILAVLSVILVLVLLAYLIPVARDKIVAAWNHNDAPAVTVDTRDNGVAVSDTTASIPAAAARFYLNDPHDSNDIDADVLCGGIPGNAYSKSTVQPAAYRIKCRDGRSPSSMDAECLERGLGHATNIYWDNLNRSPAGAELMWYCTTS